MPFFLFYFIFINSRKPITKQTSLHVVITSIPHSDSVPEEQLWLHQPFVLLRLLEPKIHGIPHSSHTDIERDSLAWQDNHPPFPTFTPPPKKPYNMTKKIKLTQHKYFHTNQSPAVTMEISVFSNTCMQINYSFHAPTSYVQEKLYCRSNRAASLLCTS